LFLCFVRSFVRSKAIEGTYIDKKCPFTGNVSIRGRILTGVVIKNKMMRTLQIGQ
jgi:small subunit ribosomal protein S11e